MLASLLLALAVLGAGHAESWGQGALGVGGGYGWRWRVANSRDVGLAHPAVLEPAQAEVEQVRLARRRVAPQAELGTKFGTVIWDVDPS